MTPLIDCIFQLLVFFMLTSTFASNTTGSLSEIGVTLPKSSKSAAKQASATLRIVVNKNGEVSIDNTIISKQNLSNTLSTYLSDHPSAKLNIYADQSAFHGHVVDIMDTARSLGFKKMGVATVGR